MSTQLGDGVRGLPIREAVGDQQVNSARSHGSPESQGTLSLCLCVFAPPNIKRVARRRAAAVVPSPTPIRMKSVSLAVAALLLLRGSVAYAQEHTHGGRSEQLGTVHFATSCSPRTTQQFDRGVALLHSFEFGASI